MIPTLHLENITQDNFFKCQIKKFEILVYFYGVFTRKFQLVPFSLLMDTSHDLKRKNVCYYLIRICSVRKFLENEKLWNSYDIEFTNDPS